ncbi:mucin-2-like [Penaeus indicus]|uniref:mucin-2-like n=1 Tax=Penaeus indicus TaxID=29960 RepID=UPI00300CBFD8
MEGIRNILLLANLLFGSALFASSAHTGRQGEGRWVDSPRRMTVFNLIKNREKTVSKKCVFPDNCLIDNKTKEQQDQDSITVNKHRAKSVFERSELRRPLTGSPLGHREKRDAVASSQSVSLPPAFPLLHQDEPRLSLHDASDPHPGSLPSKTVPERNSTISSGIDSVAVSVHEAVAPTAATGSDLVSPRLALGLHDLHFPQHVVPRDQVTFPSHHEAQITLESGGRKPHEKRSPDHYLDSGEVESVEDLSSVGLRTFWSQSYWNSGAPSSFSHYPMRPDVPTSHDFKSPTAFRHFSPQAAFPKVPAFPAAPSISPSPFSPISPPSPDHVFPSAPFTPAPRGPEIIRAPLRPCLDNCSFLLAENVCAEDFQYIDTREQGIRFSIQRLTPVSLDRAPPASFTPTTPTPTFPPTFPPVEIISPPAIPPTPPSTPTSPPLTPTQATPTTTPAIGRTLLGALHVFSGGKRFVEDIQVPK